MRKIKILFTSVGRRVELMQAFRSAADRLGVSLEIWGADMAENAPALLYCDRVVKVCRIRDKEYIPLLLALCKKEGIDALVPTIDTDLLVLSQNKSAFAKVGTTVMVADEDKVAVCRDKRYTADYFKSVGLKSPHPVDDYTKYNSGFPAFIKPKDGSSSIGAHKVENENELKAYSNQVADYIVQPFISGTEYTVDVFCGIDGDPIYITPRIREAVRAGEVLKTKIVNDEQIIDEIKALVADFKPAGAITVQLIRDANSGIDYYIEINPRFGGGAPLSIKAGADSAEALIRLLMGEKLGYMHGASADGAEFSRYDQSARVLTGKSEIKAVIFDLDDTLYSEKDYVRSGYRAVAREINQVENAYDKLYIAFEEGHAAIDKVLLDEGVFTSELKDKCVSVYRSHLPEIELYEGVREMLISLRAKGIKLGVITDGRPEGQRNKLRALGLEKLVDEIIVTDELGGEAFRKPCDIAFRIMQRKMGLPFESMVYVGDNLTKDLIVPRQLGMRAVWLDNPDAVHKVSCENRAVEKKISDVRLVDSLIR